MRLNIKYWLGGIIAILVILLAGMYIHQKNHFNKNTTINNVAIGGLTAKQAYDKVSKQSQTTKVYVNHDLVYQAQQPTKEHFTSSDEAKFTKALSEQFTFFPSHKAVNVAVKPSNFDNRSLDPARTAVTKKINQLNVGRKAPVDAYAVYKKDKVSVVPAVNGTKYNLQKTLKQVDNQAGNGTTTVTPHYQKPLAADSNTVKNEQKQLEKLTGKSVTYQVENEKYHFTSAQIITKATYKDGKYNFVTTGLDNEVKKINKKQGTLGKAFKFKTHAGNEITTAAGGSYGWKISNTKAANTLTQAILKGKSDVNGAQDIYGTGYNTGGTGYNVTANDGIGNTYAEVSLADQHAWFYKDGKCVLSTDIVSGTNNEGNRTPKGVWYIMYQQTPSVLRGQNDDGSPYASKVNYWSPFTDTGCGFHDASWRHNWSKTAYLSDGSHGCINMHPSVAGQAFHYLQKNEPVIIY